MKELQTIRGETAAARTYDAKVLKLYGKDAKLNFPREQYPEIIKKRIIN